MVSLEEEPGVRGTRHSGVLRSTQAEWTSQGTGRLEPVGPFCNSTDSSSAWNLPAPASLQTGLLSDRWPPAPVPQGRWRCWGDPSCDKSAVPLHVMQNENHAKSCTIEGRHSPAKCGMCLREAHFVTP